MADDERPDERADEPDLEMARQLAVEPLDELTRRRLVSTALREGAPAARAPRTWRWFAAAAVVLVVIGGLALLTAPGGHDEPTALQDRSGVSSGAAAPSAATPASGGDFGDLDRRANREALRDELTSSAPKRAAESQSADRSTDAAGAGALTNTPDAACPFTPPAGADVLGAGTGTIEGRRATVYLVERADGTRTYEAVLEAPCEARRLP